MRPLFASLTLLVVAMAVPVAAAQKIQLSVDVSKPGAKIDRNIFGQFAEHLGHGVYEGICVGTQARNSNPGRSVKLEDYQRQYRFKKEAP